MLDGNVHVNLLGVDEERFDAVEEVVLRLAVQAGGALSAEHGIGRAKLGWLGLMRGEADLGLMGARLKRAFDPAGLHSPGRVLPAAAGAAR